MAIAIVGSTIDTDPSGGILLVQPTDGALADFIADKLNPAIEQSPALKAKVKPQVSRSGEGSTTYLKRYPGGSMALAIANSTADLRSKTKAQDHQRRGERISRRSRRAGLAARDDRGAL
jgi:phage terminase large subunit GpA-like protein